MRAIARTLAAAAPRVALYAGNGLEHHENGVNTIRSVAMLDALLGTIGKTGGTRFRAAPELQELTVYDELPLRDLGPLGADRFPVLYETRQECHTMTAVDAILSGEPYPLRAMIVTGANPVLTNANSTRVKAAFEALDLLVVRDLFMTETAALADYVLPAASFLERTELHAHAKHHVLTLTNQVLSLPGVQDEYSFWRDLAARLGAGGVLPLGGRDGAEPLAAGDVAGSPTRSWPSTPRASSTRRRRTGTRRTSRSARRRAGWSSSPPTWVRSGSTSCRCTARRPTWRRRTRRTPSC